MTTITNTFADLGLADTLLRAIAETGYTTPTPIQAQAIPLVLQGGDLMAAAQTGTGKTAGFTLPILQILTQNKPQQRKPGRPRCLILTPTRELTAQVAESVQTYGKYASMTSMVMFGGVNINPQISALKKPVDILVATPGRLLDHVGQKTLDLSGVEILVLDEADRMLDMGFIHDIRRVLRLLPAQRQNLLFSATFSEEIRQLARGILHNPGEVSVTPRNTTTERVAQSVHLVQQSHKRDLVSHLIRESGWHQVLVFTRTKHGANRLAEKLVKDGLTAAAIHGNKSQSARTRALSGFKDGSVAVLVATDIAARGLDIDQLPLVVNFEDGSVVRFLQITMELMAHDQKAIDSAAKNIPLIRNNLLLLMSNRNYQSLMSREGKEKLRAEALAEIKDVEKKQGSADIDDVLFTSFVVQ